MKNALTFVTISLMLSVWACGGQEGSSGAKQGTCSGADCTGGQAGTAGTIGTGAQSGGGTGGSAQSGSGGSMGGSNKVCIPGESFSCGGPKGCVGFQVCNEQGTGLGPCDCGEGGSGGVGGSAGNGGVGNSSGSGGISGGGGIGAVAGSGGSAALAGSGGTGPCGSTGPNDDFDGDGFTPNMGDCNDCDPLVNPAAFDVPGDMVDNDCDQFPDNSLMPCDMNLTVDDNDPMHAAAAMGLCTPDNGQPAPPWGVISAKWVLPDGSPAIGTMDYDLGHGILPRFGPNVHAQEGVRLLALSSGAARQPGDPGFQSPSGFAKNYMSGSPTGYPKESPACPGVVTGQPFDGIALEINLLAPSNASGFSVDHKFYSYEWPDYVCSQFNDFFLVLKSPIPMGQSDGNIVFDMNNNPMSINSSSFLQVCGCANGPPCTAGTQSYECTLGNSELLGTGFGADSEMVNHAATGWLRTESPVVGGETITLRFTIYDSGDGLLDSSALIDNFRWIPKSLKPNVPTTTYPIANPL